jgi:antitoxin ParD1/3/4
LNHKLFYKKDIIMPRLSITFTPPNNDWLKTQLDSEEFSSKSDVVNDLIRKARHQHNEIEVVRAKLIRAEQRGFSDRTPEQIRNAVKSRLKETSQ